MQPPAAMAPPGAAPPYGTMFGTMPGPPPGYTQQNGGPPTNTRYSQTGYAPSKTKTDYNLEKRGIADMRPQVSVDTRKGIARPESLPAALVPLTLIGTLLCFLTMVFHTFFSFYYSVVVILWMVLLILPFAGILLYRRYQIFTDRTLPASWSLISAPPKLPQLPQTLNKPAPAVVGLAAVVFGSLVGHVIYLRDGRPLTVYAAARSYENVVPSVPADSMADAGRFVFADEASVNTSQSVGAWGDDNVLYCVSAIRDLSTSRRVEFWAVGTNCCSPQGGNFTCGAANSQTAHGAVVVHDARGLFPGQSSRSNFEAARHKAEAMFGLPPADSAFYLQWVPTTEVYTVLNGYKLWAWLWILIGTAVFALLCFFFGRCFLPSDV
eukprot:TRINITY_DN21416_c0_g1_i1.p1 TRINITY_DN21416_c0_g1~~TRINITY_DN21416_c0_g1_i1.p1  ORF type:complete len:380 (+),score=60.79 TRINITY_DN21416_c0_g1_i1:95-1234(+)